MANPKYVKHCVEVSKCQGMMTSNVEQTVHTFVEAQNNAEKNGGSRKHFVGTKIRNFMEKFGFVCTSFYVPCSHLLDIMGSPRRAYSCAVIFFTPRNGMV